jgi:hypothetical protein
MQTSNDGGIFAAINCVLHSNTNCFRKLSHRYSANTNMSHTLAIHVQCREASNSSKLFTSSCLSRRTWNSSRKCLYTRLSQPRLVLIQSQSRLLPDPNTDPCVFFFAWVHRNQQHWLDHVYCKYVRLKLFTFSLAQK